MHMETRMFFLRDLKEAGIIENRLFTQNFENRYADAVLNQYLLSLGEFGLTTFSLQGSNNSETVWVLFLIGTFLTQVTIFNMLTAIMGDTYANVTENRVEAALEQKLSILSDFVQILKVFREDEDEI